MELLLVYFVDTLLVAALLYVIWIEYKANHIALFFWVTILGIYALPAFADAQLAWAPIEIGQQVRLAGSPVLIEAPVFALLFTLAYAVARRAGLQLGAEAPVDVRTDLSDAYADDRVARRFVIFLTFASVLGCLSGLYAVYVISGSQGILESGYEQFRLYADPTYMRPAIYLLASSSGGVFLAWKVRNRTALFLIVGATFAYFLLAFARQTLMFMFAPFALYFLYAKRSLVGRLTLLAGVLAGYYFIIFLLFLRYRGANVDAIEALFSGELFQDFVPRASNEGGELALRYAYYYFIENPHATASVIPGQTYIRLLMLPIPSEYAFGFKPGLVDSTLWYAYYPEYWDVEGGTMHTLIFGDSFVNLGWAGVLLGAVWAWIAYLTTKVIRRVPRVVRTAMYAPLGFGAVGVARGSVYNASAYAFWCSLIIGGLYLLAKVSVGLNDRGALSPPSPANATPPMRRA